MTEVWYAAYGSNLLAARFRCYMEGGVAPGADGPSAAGARDPSPPTDERATFLPWRLGFVYRSSSWQQGGVAVIGGEATGDEQTLGRLWRLTVEQFEDVVRQENDDQQLCVDLDRLLVQGSDDIGSGAYGRLLYGGERDGLPIVTCTGLRFPPEETAAPPSLPYLRCLIAGLRETFNLNKQGVKRYLRRLPGIADGGVSTELLGKAFTQAEELLAADEDEDEDEDNADERN